MQQSEEGARAFSTFRVLNGDANIVERDQLFRNMAQLYSYVSDRCDDEQVAQYDEVLCQLADLVEAQARSHVARLLAPLERAPGMVVVKLANDDIEVARPLLEFSNVLSDDDLIDIVTHHGEAHRIAIAGRSSVTERVGDAIVEHGGPGSVGRLVRNGAAELSPAALAELIKRAGQDSQIAADLGGRTDIDWNSVRNEIDAASARILEHVLGKTRAAADPSAASKLNTVVYNRLRNRAGFSSQEWKVAYNQVKALSDRRQLDQRALMRFARFGYGHHLAAALAVKLGIAPELMVKWLATQDYVALTVSVRMLDIAADLFEAMIACLPWRDLPTDADRVNVRRRFEALGTEEATAIFELWRSHSFRKRPAGDDRSVA